MRCHGAAVILVGLSSVAVHVSWAHSLPSLVKGGLVLFVGFLLFNLLITDRYQTRWMPLLISIAGPTLALFLVVLANFTSGDTAIMAFFGLAIFTGFLKMSTGVRSVLYSQREIQIMTIDKAVAILAKQNSCSLPREPEWQDKSLWDDKAFKAS